MSIYIIHDALFAEEYGQTEYMFRLVVWFARLSVWVNDAPATPTRFAKWFAIKTRVD